MISKIDWNNITFISKEDTWFTAGSRVKLIGDSDLCLNVKISDGSGLFEGKTDETYSGYDGELPRLDEEYCPFDEFDIYYDDILINNIGYADVIIMITQREREKKLKSIYD